MFDIDTLVTRVLCPCSVASVISGVASLLFLDMSSHISVVWHSRSDAGHGPGEHIELGPGLTYIPWKSAGFIGQQLCLLKEAELQRTDLMLGGRVAFSPAWVPM